MAAVTGLGMNLNYTQMLHEDNIYLPGAKPPSQLLIRSDPFKREDGHLSEVRCDAPPNRGKYTKRYATCYRSGMLLPVRYATKPTPFSDDIYKSYETRISIGAIDLKDSTCPVISRQVIHLQISWLLETVPNKYLVGTMSCIFLLKRSESLSQSTQHPAGNWTNPLGSLEQFPTNPGHVTFHIYTNWFMIGSLVAEKTIPHIAG